MKSIELFAGAGGLGLGVSLAGFKPVEIVEWDSYCCETIRRNRERGITPVSDWPLTAGDVRSIDFRDHEGKIDLVTGGPPCQPFSIGGKHNAHKDVRDMFPQAVRVLRETKPKAFIFENVKGLTRQTFVNYIEYIRLQMAHPDIVIREESWLDHLARLECHETSGSREGLRYKVVVHLANAADHGVPQRRERVFFVGFRSDLKLAWSFPPTNPLGRCARLGPIQGRRLLGSTSRQLDASALDGTNESKSVEIRRAAAVAPLANRPRRACRLAGSGA